jgi:hypothetical protein
VTVVAWSEIAKYVAAGNVSKVDIGTNFDVVSIEIVYSSIPRDGREDYAEICLECVNCGYLDLRRRNDHEPGSGIVLEAYLRTESALVDDLRSHKLDGVSGCLEHETAKPVFHLEIIGEISLNILCEELKSSVRWKPTAGNSKGTTEG